VPGSIGDRFLCRCAVDVALVSRDGFSARLRGDGRLAADRKAAMKRLGIGFLPEIGFSG
jgi:hypothetical protein